MVAAGAVLLHPEGGGSHLGYADILAAGGAAWPGLGTRRPGSGATAELVQALAAASRGRCKTQFLQAEDLGALPLRRPPGRHFLCGPEGGAEPPSSGPRQPGRPSRTAFSATAPVEGSAKEHAHGEGQADQPGKDVKVNIDVKLPENEGEQDEGGEGGEGGEGAEHPQDNPTEPAQTDELSHDEQIAFDAANEAAKEQSDIDHGVEKPEALTKGEEAAYDKGMHEAQEELAKHPPHEPGMKADATTHADNAGPGRHKA
mmetsp:Transcript_74972/g.223406  ORF Transcript_74972/g.223406 Transcript_74972/m.223406 type:complete len:258 (-) Transcript_74972:57-830(-)